MIGKHEQSIGTVCTNDENFFIKQTRYKNYMPMIEHILNGIQSS